MALWALPMIGAGVVALCLPMQSNPAMALAFGFAPLAFVAIAVIDSWLFARRYASGSAK